MWRPWCETESWGNCPPMWRLRKLKMKQLVSVAPIHRLLLAGSRPLNVRSMHCLPPFPCDGDVSDEDKADGCDDLLEQINRRVSSIRWNSQWLSHPPKLECICKVSRKHKPEHDASTNRRRVWCKLTSWEHSTNHNTHKSQHPRLVSIPSSTMEYYAAIPCPCQLSTIHTNTISYEWG